MLGFHLWRILQTPIPDPTLADVKTAATDLGIWWVVAVGILITLAVLLVRRARRA